MSARSKAQPKGRGDAPDSNVAIDIMVQSPLWNEQPAAVAAVREAIEAAGDVLFAPEAEVSVLMTDDAAIRILNREWRGIDKATNVLSFPAGKNAQPMLGDIVIAYETLARECADERKDFLHHLSHLTVHGFLHLMGYDHDTDQDADAMEALESGILARLGIADPYLARDFRDA